MKPYFFFFLLLIPIASAIFGGETETIFNDDCSNLTVNISIEPYQDDNEYSLIPDCDLKKSHGNSRLFFCECKNNKTILNITPKINSYGNYTIIIKTDVLQEVEEEEEDDDDSSSSSGGGGGSVSLRLVKQKPRTIYLKQYAYSSIKILNEYHKIRIVEIGTDYVILEIRSDIINATLKLNENKKIDMNKDDYYDLRILLKEIRGTISIIEFETINEFYGKKEVETAPTIKEPVVNATDTTVNETTVEIEQPKESSGSWIVVVTILIIILLIGLVGFLLVRKFLKGRSEMEG